MHCTHREEVVKQPASASTDRLMDTNWTQETSLKKKNTLVFNSIVHFLEVTEVKVFGSPLSCMAICGLLVAYVIASDALKFKPAIVLVQDLSMFLTFEESPALINSVGQQEQIELSLLNRLSLCFKFAGWSP